MEIRPAGFVAKGRGEQIQCGQELRPICNYRRKKDGVVSARVNVKTDGIYRVQLVLLS